jgi:hypothetical protein
MVELERALVEVEGGRKVSGEKLGVEAEEGRDAEDDGGSGRALRKRKRGNDQL